MVSKREKGGLGGGGLKRGKLRGGEGDKVVLI